MSLREFLVLMMVCLIWGLHFVVMKVTVGAVAEPLFYAAVRMTIVAIILVPWLKWHNGLMPYVFGAGLGYGAFNYAFSFPALEFTTASAAAVTIELFVPFSIILSMIFFKERMGKFKIVGVALALSGVSMIANAGPEEVAGPYFLFGIFLVACAAMSEAIGAILVKFVKSVKPLELLAWFAVVGAIVLWGLTFALEENQLAAFSEETRIPFAMALIYSSLLVSIVAHSSYYWLLQRLPIYVVSSTGLMTTVVGVGSSVLILKEPLSVWLVVGAVTTLLGVAIILWRKTASTDSSSEN